MKQTGRVIALNGKTATVRFKRSSACGKCHACFTLASDEADIEIENSLGAQEGDDVTIELHGRSVVKASLIAYGIPLVALIIGVALGSLIGDAYAAMGGVLFAAGTFFILRGLEPRLSRMSELKPRMTGFAEEEENDG